METSGVGQYFVFCDNRIMLQISESVRCNYGILSMTGLVCYLIPECFISTFRCKTTNSETCDLVCVGHMKYHLKPGLFY